MDKSNLKSNDMCEQIINEVKIMYSLNHENIIKLNNHFEDEKNVYLILEFASGVNHTSFYLIYSNLRANFIKTFINNLESDITRKHAQKYNFASFHSNLF